MTRRSSVVPAVVAAVATLLGVLVAPGDPAAAGTATYCRWEGRASVCTIVDVPDTVEEVSSPIPADDIEWYYYRTFVEGGEGLDEGEVGRTGCWAIGATTDPEAGGTLDEAQAAVREFTENGELWGACSADVVLDPDDVAAMYWEGASSPPPPTPLHVAPGRALTGLPAYLEIGGDNPYTETHDTPLGVLTFSMTPRYVVSWGDGATVETESQGGPYPDGDLVHTYTDAEAITITVDAYWRTGWTLAGESGSLPERPVPTSADLDLDVEQRQVVTN